LAVLAKLVLIVAVGYAALVAMVYLSQTRMIYLPDLPGRQLTAVPRDIGMEYRDVTLRTSDGVDIHGWFVPGPGSRVLLFFHGNAGNISHRLDSIRQFHSLGLSVFIIDYRGYGQSGGRPSEAGMARDALAAWEYLSGDMGIDPGDIILFGRSLGGSIAAELAANTEPLALIVESAFTSVPDIAGELYPWLPARWLSRMRHATRDYVADARAPVLVIHSRDDEIIPYHHGERIFESAGEPRTLLPLRGSHNDAWLRDKANYIRGLREFIASLPGPATAPD
jgi:fermentation-respiration switch protein FrsA (DUF1100 family)